MKTKKKLFNFLIVFSLNFLDSFAGNVQKRALQKSHEKPKAVKYMEVFLGNDKSYDQTPSLVNLVNMIASSYIKDCVPVVLYDQAVEKNDFLLLEQLFRISSLAYIHGQITKKHKVKNSGMLNSFENKCVAYILFMADVMKSKEVIGEQNENKVVIIARSSQWRVYEFLASEFAQSFVNLLVIAKSERIAVTGEELPFILYTHDLYIDGLGSSAPKVLTSWFRGNLTRPHVNLFPGKFKDGFAGHRFVVSLANQPPFVVKRGTDENDNTKWDGIEVRLISMLSELYNFTTDFKEVKNQKLLSPGDAVAEEVRTKKANLGVSGIYVTQERIAHLDVSISHSQDCASFISLTSTALPKYRAIMGPFHWTVWLALTLTYLFAIFPISFSDNHSLKHLIKSPEEIENMFWYVFGTFTNCFTFAGRYSWNKSEKLATRLLIGFYWIFTIITTACYTGSIIAFVTIPVYPQTIDTVKQLLDGRYQVGTLDKGGWEYWFQNSSDPLTTKLLKNVELLSNIESGLRNTTKAFFWPYAFLGSQAELNYIVRTNFSTTTKRSVLHISSECFVPYGVSFIFGINSVYTNILNEGIQRAVQSGFNIKFKHDVEWNVMRSATGKLLQANAASLIKRLTVEDRALTLDDTQGMFLLLSVGFVMGGTFFLSEWLGGCFNLCKRKRIESASSIASNKRSYDTPTPREKLDSIQFNNIPINFFESIIDLEPEQTSNESNERVVVAEIETNSNKSNPSIMNEETSSSSELMLLHETNKATSSENVSEIVHEIDALFNFDEVFGDVNNDETTNEELDETL